MEFQKSTSEDTLEHVLAVHVYRKYKKNLKGSSLEDFDILNVFIKHHDWPDFTIEGDLSICWKLTPLNHPEIVVLITPWSFESVV